MLFEEIILLIDETPRPAALNMAIDEVLLRQTANPVLRFYRWRRASVSFGYFEKYAAVARQYPAREPVRRWTGGGVVSHGEDVTYSLVVPASEIQFLAIPLADSYARLHAALAEAMAECGVAAALSRNKVEPVSNACFANPVCHDVLVDAKKAAGAAQRRTQWGMLHQGSIQRVKLPPEFPNRFAERLGRSVRVASPDESQVVQAAALADQKYATDAWLRRC